MELTDQSKISKLETAEKNKRHISKKEILFVCAFSVMLVFNYFIFNQLDIILHNQAEFGIVIREVIGIYLLFTFLIFLAVISVLTALCYFFKRGFQYTIATLIGLILSGYFQILFLNNTDIMNVNGFVTASVWEYILNTIIHLVIIAAPIVILNKIRAKTKKEESEEEKKEKTPQKKFSMPKLVLAFSAIVFGMQMIGVTSTIPTAAKPAKDNELYYFSIDDQLKLSQNDNIVVFILDRNDTAYADAAFSDPVYKDIFSGFTYYRDNIAQYPGTFPSVASLLTGNVFDSQRTQTAYMKNAWEDPMLFEALRANNYKINGLLNTIATFYDFKDLTSEENGKTPKFDNIKKVAAKNRRVNHGAFFSSMFKSALHRLSPYAFKWAFTGYIETVNKCIEIKNTPDYYNRTISPASDLKFYDRLNDVGLSADEDQNVFNFVHLLASHNPYGYNENLETVKQSNIYSKERTVAQTRGTYRILEEYFTQMKDLGVYEDATIIVMADHGDWATLKNRNSIEDVPMAALFIKEKGNGSNNKETVIPLEIDHTSQLSHSNFLPTMIEVLYNNNNNSTNQTYLDTIKESSYSYFDVTKPVAVGGLGGKQERLFYYVRWTNMNSTKYFWTYKIDGKANDTNNWHKIKQ